MKLKEFAHINPKTSLNKNTVYPFVEMAEITVGKRYVVGQQRKEFKGSCTKFQNMDTLLARITPCLQNGKIAQYKSTQHKYAFGSTEFIVFRAKENVSDSSYLYYLASSSIVTDPAIKSMSGATGRQRVSIDAVQSIEIDTVSLGEQRKIAAILSAYDDLIENNNRRIQILEEMAQRLYKQWFVDFKFPNNENAKFVESEVGLIPEQWKLTKLGSKINVRKGKNITKKTIVAGTVPVVAGGLVPAYYHNTPNTEEPVITISASGANAGFVKIYFNKVWASDCSFIDKSTTPFIYFYYLMLKCKQREVTALQRGAAQPHVYPKDLMELKTPDYPDDLTKAFEDIVTPIMNLVKNLEQKNVNLSKTRDLLLPRLISGEVSVENIEVAA